MTSQPVEIKSKQQAARTIAESALIDRGFLKRALAAIITIIAIVSAVAGWWVVFALLYYAAF